jgi:hypothetical protein
VIDPGAPGHADIADYIAKRVDDQLAYFDASAIKNQRAYKRLKSTSIVCNVLTTMTIALAFTVSEKYKVYMGILALVVNDRVSDVPVGGISELRCQMGEVPPCRGTDEV